MTLPSRLYNIQEAQARGFEPYNKTPIDYSVQIVLIDNETGHRMFVICPPELEQRLREKLDQYRAPYE